MNCDWSCVCQWASGIWSGSPAGESVAVLFVLSDVFVLFIFLSVHFVIYCNVLWLFGPQPLLCNVFLFRLSVWFFLPSSRWSIATPLFLQKNWLCASQDASLLPPTALAERATGDHYTTDGLNSILYILAIVPSHSSAASLLSFSLLHSSFAANKLMKHTENWHGPTLLVDNWMWRFDHSVLFKSLNCKTLTT